MICPKCGKYVADYSLFCWFCGQSLTPPQPEAKEEAIVSAEPEKDGFDEEAIPDAASVAADGPDKEFDNGFAEAASPAQDGPEENDETDIDAAPDETGAPAEEDTLAVEEELGEGEFDKEELSEEELGPGLSQAAAAADPACADAPDAAPVPEEGESLEAGEAAADTGPAKAANIKPAPDQVSYKPLRNLILGAFILALLLLCWFLLLSPSARFDRNMSKAEACMEQSDYQAALDHYMKAAAIEPTAEALQGQAAACLNLGDTDGALACYRQLLEQEPELESVYAAIAEVYQARGEYREALSALDQGIEKTSSATLQKQLNALLAQLGITDYTAEEVAAADNIWPVGKVDLGGGPGRALATDIDVVAVLDKASGALTVSRNGLDSDGVMADLAVYEGSSAEAEDSFRPWLELADGGVPVKSVEIGGGVVNIGSGA